MSIMPADGTTLSSRPGRSLGKLRCQDSSRSYYTGDRHTTRACSGGVTANTSPRAPHHAPQDVVALEEMVA
jgi:hypothetical protein